MNYTFLDWEGLLTGFGEFVAQVARVVDSGSKFRSQVRVTGGIVRGIQITIESKPQGVFYLSFPCPVPFLTKISDCYVVSLALGDVRYSYWDLSIPLGRFLGETREPVNYFEKIDNLFVVKSGVSENSLSILKVLNSILNAQGEFQTRVRDASGVDFYRPSYRSISGIVV